MAGNVVFVNKDNMALFTCPNCEKMKHVSVAKFKDTKHSFRVKCGCGESFPVDLNFRSKFRKDTKLFGYYHNVTGKRIDPKFDESNCNIVNLSLDGIGLQLTDDNELAVGDEVGIEFVLDDTKSSEIRRRFVVRHVGADRSVGGEFCDGEEQMYNKIIGFYLMP